MTSSSPIGPPPLTGLKVLEFAGLAPGPSILSLPLPIPTTTTRITSSRNSHHPTPAMPSNVKPPD
ncbi:hypothetical protein E4U25_003178 [Claviceps purpurea]|nr:hypothetical protein E4U25_003178 [Claviceps purpurea]